MLLFLLKKAKVTQKTYFLEEKEGKDLFVFAPFFSRCEMY